jgi:hypothetical protein
MRVWASPAGLGGTWGESMRPGQRRRHASAEGGGSRGVAGAWAAGVSVMSATSRRQFAAFTGCRAIFLLLRATRPAPTSPWAAWAASANSSKRCVTRLDIGAD